MFILTTINTDMSETIATIEVEGIRKSYGDTEALRGVDLSVKKAEVFGLIGPDGAGKTSLMRILCGLMNFNEGQVSVAGFNVDTQTAEVKKRLGYMPQRFSLYPDLTVGENIRFFADLFQVNKVDYEVRFKELMHFSKLEPFIKRRAANLSGGMKQKLALCCTLIHTPEVLILDEPTTGVDPISRIEFWDMIGRLSKDGVTVLVSTPYMDEANRCHRIALIHKGNILAQGTPQGVTKLFTDKVLELRGQALFDLRNQVSSYSSVKAVHLFGDRMHIMTDNIQSCRQELVSKLEIKESDLKEVSPSIEDTFISLLN
jgi:ABC-2 type transport system ATP-binding protein